MTQISRRDFLLGTAASGATLGEARARGVAQAPGLVTAERLRPQMPSGVQIGDVVGDRALVWSRTDRPARLIVQRAYRPDFADAVRVVGPVARETSDYVTRLDLQGLEAGRDVFLRVSFEDLDTGRTSSAPLDARFRAAPAARRDVRVCWSADTAGQGFGINPDWGGMRTYDAMRRAQPDFFVHTGDTIYADGPIPPAVTLADGSIWRNIVTDEVAKVAETLREFRGRYAYNLMDAHVRQFAAEVPQVWQWDDHEVLNNWSDAKDLTGDRNYTEKNVRRLAARGLQAFLEYAPIRYHGLDESDRVYRRISYGPLLDVFVLDGRSYRGPNSFNRQTASGPETAFLGAAQLRWLKEALVTSTAQWKVISSDMPIGLLVGDGQDAEKRPRFEAIANGDGPPLGREFEVAELLAAMKAARVRNVIWITGDVHYTAAHRYDPARARFPEFDPFWEFVSGPLNAGSFGPGRLDDTFGPEVMFQKFSPVSGAAPSAGYQFFGQIDINGKSGLLTVTLKDGAGAPLFARELTPEP